MASKSISILLLSFMLSCAIMLLVADLARAGSPRPLPLCRSKNECELGMWCGDGKGGKCFAWTCDLQEDCLKRVRCSDTPGPYCMEGICQC
ncbi:unnamed protein product [Thlaspi arvense]|uniref:Uncharacterized protein n=1 Tax=Thlaspi arvense TaxID=13288 RepID=A0AAU9RL27_THLAR|nr:unnamed protein product [Thlaspi arvense]